MTYRNITEVKRANKAAGYFWFSPATRKHWGARVETPVMDGRFWVESARTYDDEGREYKLVYATDDAGAVDYFRAGGTDILRFPTRAEAIDALVEYIAKEKEAADAG
jgi:hypothetical protein